MDELDISKIAFDLKDLDAPQHVAPTKKSKKQDDDQPMKHVAVIKRNTRNIYRRAFSETQLLDVLNLDMKDGEAYHCISGGDVDSLSYLKVVLRQQQLDYCLFSTWCMAMDDILQLKSWLDAGKIKHLDAYVGEIFPNSYTREWQELRPVIKNHGGRIVVFRNHSKVYAGYGPKFAFAIESSANINTNPRAENTCITIGRDIYEFYKSYYDEIISFVKEDR